MKLIEENELLDRLQELLSKATRVDIAIAWIRTGKALDAITLFAKANPGKLRLLCGVNSFLTELKAIRQILSVGQLRIAFGTSGKKFHTKLFLYRTKKETFAWVGSPNLTESAFSSNSELVCEFSDDGEAREIFEEYWHLFGVPDEDWLKRYEALCKWQNLPPRDGPNLGQPSLSSSQMSWKAYVSKLKLKDGDRLDLIAATLPEVTRLARGNWEEMNKDQAEKLLGLAKGYGGLGRLKAAGIVKNIFFEKTQSNLAIRLTIRALLDSIPKNPASPHFQLGLKQAFESITNIDRVGAATASRLLALQYPDRFVSVNSASAMGLSELSGIPRSSLYTATGYNALIRWVMKQEWWSTEDPMDETTVLWRQRAAVLDVLVYRGGQKKGTRAEVQYNSMDE